MVPRDVVHAVQGLCLDAGTPRALMVSKLLEAGEWGQILSLKVDPLSYTNASSFFWDNLVTEVFRKCQGFPTAVNLREKAVEGFWASEGLCLKTNERLSPLLYGACTGTGGRVEEFVSLAKNYIKFVLGPCPEPDRVIGRFGPGATLADRGKLTTVADKMSSSPTCTEKALRFLPSWSQTAWARAVSSHRGVVQVARGNRFTTVPKDSSKDRGICIEPSINLFFQLGYGRVIRGRLSKIGIDLVNGQLIHRCKAREASSQRHLATIDLSSASDTVSRELVRLLLPSGWFDVLDSLRSPTTTIDGKIVVLEKFSSMGNGFTFELETLVFLALCFAAMVQTGHMPREGRNLFVYGDDIIIPNDAYQDVVAVLNFFGFRTNGRKSFHTGDFRESCGGDYFGGTPVRAFYLEEFPSEPHQWIAMANGIRRVVKDFHPEGGDPCNYLRGWRAAISCLPTRVRNLCGPESLGDIVVHTGEDRWDAKSGIRSGSRLRRVVSYDPRAGDGIRYVRTWSPASHRYIGWNHFRPDVVVACALYGVGDGARGVSPRDNVLGYAERWVAVP